MIRYEKLVRDKIPQLIAGQGEHPIIRILDDAEYTDCLERKLDEEVAQVPESYTGQYLKRYLE